MNVGGIFLYSSNKEEATGSVTDLAAYVSPDYNDDSTWTAATGTPSQCGNVEAMVTLELTDAEVSRYAYAKFTSSRTDLADLIVGFGPEGNLYAGGGIENPVRCSRSGIFFPASRIRENAKGRKYGDTFFVEADKEWMS
jgi:hypothetical protein